LARRDDVPIFPSPRCSAKILTVIYEDVFSLPFRGQGLGAAMSALGPKPDFSLA